jgi:restriction endonuclease S subunit
MMPRYAVYKDFGVEGRDNPTDRWDSKALKYLVDYNIETLAEDTNPDYELKYIEIGDVNNIGEILNTTTYSFKNAPSRCRRVLSKDDVFISTVRTYLKAIGYIKEECEDFVCSTGFCVLSPKESLNPGYLYYSIIDEKFLNEVISKSTGVSYPAITPTQLVNIRINIPTLPEQTHIVEFLEAKTSLIDKLISVKQRKIELLKEKRTALINHVVTKGLEPNVKMKESGVEWIGEIPEHWIMSRFKYDSTTPVKYGLNIGSEKYKEKGIRFIRITDITESGELINEDGVFLDNEDVPNEFYLNNNDVLFCRSGHTVGKSYLHRVNGQFTSGGYLVRFNFRNKTEAKFIFFIGKTKFYWDWIKLNSVVSTIENVNGDKFQNFQYAKPPIAEQTQIVEYLDEKTTEIDNLLTLERKKIDLLKEYRQSLISEVVTGKIKVMKDDYSTQQAEHDA